MTTSLTHKETDHRTHSRPVLACVIAVISMLYISSGWPATQNSAAPDGVVEPRPAPAWDIAEWLNKNPGNVGNNLESVIVIDFFQLWCPGCNSFTGPLMQKWQDRFSDEITSGDLLLVKIHTVFEGHNYQTVRRLKQYVIDKGITMPVGVDRHDGNDYLPETKKHYKTSGTPEVVIIDRDGMIRFQKFGWFDPVATEKYIDFLLGVSDSPKRQKPVLICLASELC